MLDLESPSFIERGILSTIWLQDSQSTRMKLARTKAPMEPESNAIWSIRIYLQYGQGRTQFPRCPTSGQGFASGPRLAYRLDVSPCIRRQNVGSEDEHSSLNNYVLVFIKIDTPACETTSAGDLGSKQLLPSRRPHAVSPRPLIQPFRARGLHPPSCHIFVVLYRGLIVPGVSLIF